MTAPLMPKATAVWLVENTTLTFRQIGNFCELHELEVQAIADGDVAANIVGVSPIATGQLTAEEIVGFAQLSGNYRFADLQIDWNNQTDNCRIA